MSTNDANDTVIEIPGSEYGEVVIINEYNGVYSLCSGREGKEGKVYKNWAFPQDKDKKPREKAIPVKVTLGDQNTARDVVLKIAKVFGVADMAMCNIKDEPDPRERNKSDYGKPVEHPEDDLPF